MKNTKKGFIELFAVFTITALLSSSYSVLNTKDVKTEKGLELSSKTIKTINK